MQDDSNFNKDSWFSNIIRKPDSGVIKSEYKTPIFIDDDKNYVIKINEILEKLINDFAVIKDNTLFTEIVCDYQKFIRRVMDFYFQGHIGNAALEMKTYIEDLIDGSKGIALSNIKNSIAFNDKEIIISNIKNDKSIDFFRARVSEHFCEYKRNEMLHIPFNQREKISSARFSIQGLPCLYLGTTSYCCWLEMDTPADHQFNVSAVSVNEDMKILNLTLNSCDLEHLLALSNDRKIFQEGLKLWLLALSSSFVVRQSNRSFKTEYVIPQLIMLAANELNLDGGSYYSKRVKDDRLASMNTVNLALFAKYNGEEKYSKICKDILLTPSVNFSMYKQLNYDATYRADDISPHIQDTMYPKVIGSFERQYQYSETKFYSFDKYLLSLKNEMKNMEP